MTLLPKTLVEPLQQHLVHVKSQHERAMQRRYGGVELPHALARKDPNATHQWEWQYVFPGQEGCLFLDIGTANGVFGSRQCLAACCRGFLDWLKKIIMGTAPANRLSRSSPVVLGVWVESRRTNGSRDRL